MKKRFYLDKQNGMAMGVCAGLARQFDVDATFVRIGAVLVTLLAFPWTLIAYAVAAWAAKPLPVGDYTGSEAGMLRGSTHDYRASSSDLDRRLAEVDTYVAGPNSGLSREIEELR